MTSRASSLALSFRDHIESLGPTANPPETTCPAFGQQGTDRSFPNHSSGTPSSGCLTPLPTPPARH
ncbi:hypothetical protein BN12_1610008 [Nostocoides japonicum T1-X7]|uniref:Uncharacterized protein n=1 Tax=Nostocoides japonicum T1-X7 TaxID=1194083 RepID=A0A077LYM0_9MICO|nr:hypothetical protein BN12_1610008 [Tetrasphaera japonica T1-X7]